QTHEAAAEERVLAQQRVKEIGEQADALLTQATRDAGRIVADAEKKAEQIGGDAYTALRDKQLLEQAAAAMRNVIEGYGDRYIIPTHSVLDDLAIEFGYDAAGVALKSAREQCRRMVEKGEAAACDYEEAEQKVASATMEQKAYYEQELQKLRQELADATQRALTIAQQTKKGHVYIISNVGSFGEGVYKIGLTRRPEPQDRVDELGGASV